MTTSTEKRITKPSKKLTDAACKNAKWEATSSNVLGDAMTQGLELRVGKQSKSWVFKYTRPAGGRTNLMLGRYNSDEKMGITLANARELAQAAAKQLRAGIDPGLAAKVAKTTQAMEQGDTFKGAIEVVLGQVKRKFTDRHYQEVKARAELHIIPKLGHLPLKDITSQIVAEVLQPLYDAGKHTTLKRCCQLISQTLNDAVEESRLDVNRCATTYKRRFALSKDQRAELVEEGKLGNMATIPPLELPNLMAALRSEHLEPVTRQCLEFQLLTMARPGEAATAEWCEIDLEARTWTIPAKKMKKRIEHVIHLSEQALAILAEAKPTYAGRRYIFSGTGNKETHISKSTTTIALRRLHHETKELKTKLVAHGMRALAATTLTEKGFRAAWIERALAHGLVDKTQAAYVHANHFAERAMMLDKWGEHVEKAKTGPIDLLPYNVTQIGKRDAA